jgi:hypothetical protein
MENGATGYEPLPRYCVKACWIVYSRRMEQFMEPTTKQKQASSQNIATTGSAPKPRRYFKGRPVYSDEQAADPNFEFPFPTEPEWETEWKKRKAAKARK